MAKKKTSFRDLYEYSSNNLSCERMQDVGKSIKNNGEAPMLFHQMMFSYSCNRSYYEELMGNDDYWVKKNQKNLDRKEQNGHLREKQVNKSNNQLNNEIMKNYERMGLNLPKNMSEVRTAIDGLQPMIEEIKQKYNGDARAFAYNYFENEFGFGREEVDEIVDDLLKGIRKFDAGFEKYMADGFMATSKMLDEALERLPFDKQQEYLAGVLTALQAVPENIATQEELDKLLDANKKKSLEDLKVEVSENLEGCMTSITSSFFNDFNPENGKITPEELAEIKIEANTNVITEEHKLNVALALYIAQLEGNIDYFKNGDVDAELTGMAAAAGVSADYVTNQFVNGEVEFEPWQKIMKFILGALFMVAMGIIGTILVAGSSIGVVGILMLMFGQGILASIIALIIACIFGKAMTEKIFDYIDWLLQKIETPYDNLVLNATEWVKTKIAAWKKDKTEDVSQTESTKQSELESEVERNEEEEKQEGEEEKQKQEENENENYSKNIAELYS